MNGLDGLARARAVVLDEAFQRVAAERPDPEDVLALWHGATPEGRVLLALLLDPERGRHALATLALDERVAAHVRPMLANEATYAAAPAPRPDGADEVLARRFAAALAELCARAGTTPGDLAREAGVTLAPLPDHAACEALERALRERTLFAPGLLDLATRRVVEVTQDGGPAPGDLDALCPEIQRVLDEFTRADVPAFPASPGRLGRRGVRLGRAVEVPVPPGVTLVEGASPHDPDLEYVCDEHNDFVIA